MTSTWGEPEKPRMCLNCGKICDHTIGRNDNACNFPDKEMYPCTIDMSFNEMIEEIKRLRRELMNISHTPTLK